jgi:methionine-R-sulfoxide reductase
MAFNKLSPEEEKVIVQKGTEPPGTGEYNDFFGEGLYTCRRCGKPLYKSESKFEARCGWPSFDQVIPGAVERNPNPDGMRTEITCATCGAHLSHIFIGENLTPKDTRYCVNSISMRLCQKKKLKPKKPPFLAADVSGL